MVSAPEPFNTLTFAHSHSLREGRAGLIAFACRLPFSHYEHVLLEKSERKTSEVYTSEALSLLAGVRHPTGISPRLSTGFLQSHWMDVKEMIGGCRLCALSEPGSHGLKGSEPPAILTVLNSVLNMARGDDNLSKACGTHKKSIKQNQTTHRGHHLPAPAFYPKVSQTTKEPD